ncbi:MAG: hypothetical protein R3297_03025 [Desulfobulbales bacterium]|nr:hypothetical protein [Desulfobulbales bacterium]
MRCTKCGFISFDHLMACAKCGKDIADVASELQGTSIKVETPMFLSGALATYADKKESLEEHAMETEIDDAIDFSMEDEGVEEEVLDMAGPQEDVDFSFEDEEGAVDITLAEAEAEEGLGTMEAESAEAVDIASEAEDVVSIDAGPEEAADISLEEEAGDELEAPSKKVEESFEELDFMGVVDDEEEGGLEFDLEDFIEDMDNDK